MFQQKKRKKILGSWRKEEEEVSSEHKEDMSSNIMAKYDDSEQCSDLRRCVWAMFQPKKFQPKKRQRLVVLEGSLKKLEECECSS